MRLDHGVPGRLGIPLEPGRSPAPHRPARIPGRRLFTRIDGVPKRAATSATGVIDGGAHGGVDERGSKSGLRRRTAIGERIYDPIATSNRATDAPASVSAQAYWEPRRPKPPVTMATAPSSRNRSVLFCNVIGTGSRPVTYRKSRAAVLHANERVETRVRGHWVEAAGAASARRTGGCSQRERSHVHKLNNTIVPADGTLSSEVRQGSLASGPVPVVVDVMPVRQAAHCALPRGLAVGFPRPQQRGQNR